MTIKFLKQFFTGKRHAKATRDGIESVKSQEDNKVQLILSKWQLKEIYKKDTYSSFLPWLSGKL